MYDSRTLHTREVLASIVNGFGDKVFHTVINRTVRFPDATVAGEPITSFDSGSMGAIPTGSWPRRYWSGGGRQAQDGHGRVSFLGSRARWSTPGWRCAGSASRPTGAGAVREAIAVLLAEDFWTRARAGHACWPRAAAEREAGSVPDGERRYRPPDPTLRQDMPSGTPRRPAQPVTE